MDGRRFDHWIRTFSLAQTRRQAMRTMAAGVAGGLLGALGWRRDVAAICQADGAQCTTSGECCSGLCEITGKKKKSRRGKKKGKKPKKFCAATPANAQGCTIEMDNCVPGPVIRCPNNDLGRCHIVEGRPICASERCGACRDDSECNAGERCLYCPACSATVGGKICIKGF